jgi:predicted cupin superfamily sugar epimerase
MASTPSNDSGHSTSVLPSEAGQPGSAAGELIARLGLQPHPEGGWFRELYRAEEAVQRQRDGQRRCGLTLIAYLLQRGERSRWHRVRGSDEIWLHAGGAPLDLWALPPEGGQPRLLGLGSLTEDDPVGGGAGVAACAPVGEPGPTTAAGSAASEGAAGDGDLPSRVIRADWWQAARSRGDWSLVHCVVGPGFAFEDFEILALRPAAQRPPGAREDLL